MTISNSSGYLSLVTAAAIVEGQRVKITAAGLYDVATTADIAVGVATMSAASGGNCTAKLWTAPGTFLCRAGGAITAGARVYPTTAGNVLATGTTQLNLVAMTAAAASGDIIECLPCLVGA